MGAFQRSLRDDSSGPAISATGNTIETLRMSPEKVPFKPASSKLLAEQCGPQGLEAHTHSKRLRGPEGQLFHGGAHISEFFTIL
jgi:hypothetical protein